MPELLFILGTRPEAIKCAPVIRTCREDSRFRVQVLTTSQHRELQDQVLDYFRIQPHFDLDLMREQPDLARLIGDAWRGLCRHFSHDKPSMVLVQGDTSTAFIAALAAQYHRIPVAHIEAGLRTHDKTMPFPEEINRRLIGPIADLHLAPTHQAKNNLLKENIDPSSIYVVGNPGIDALLYAVKDQKDVPIQSRFPQWNPTQKQIIVTCHRRENWGEPAKRICQALKILLNRYPELQIFFLMHPNPQASEPIRQAFHDSTKVVLCDSVIYPDMALLLHSAYLIMTDSGGIQEEAPVLGKPVLVLREKTERTEGIHASAAQLVGTDPEKIVSLTERLLHDGDDYLQHAQPISPYGDGHASQRIAQAIAHFFGMDNPPDEFPSI